MSLYLSYQLANLSYLKPKAENVREHQNDVLKDIVPKIRMNH